VKTDLFFFMGPLRLTVKLDPISYSKTGLIVLPFALSRIISNFVPSGALSKDIMNKVNVPHTT